MQDIPYGFCHCGCGRKTTIAKWSESRSGAVKGEPRLWAQGHGPRKRVAPETLRDWRQRWDLLGMPYGLCLCGCGESTSIAVASDASRGWIRGEPLKYVLGHAPRAQPLPPLSDYYEIRDCGYKTPCWVWQRNLNRRGYGLIKRDGKTRNAARFVLKEVGRPVPEGLEVDHLCFNPPCVNPDHLEAVTRVVNQRRRRTVKLTPDDVRAIRAARQEALAAAGLGARGPLPGSRELQRELAAKYGVSPDHVRQLQRGVTWREIT